MRGGVVVAAALAVSAWVACGHSYDSGAELEGAQGQACYPNSTCLGGLTCTNGTCLVAAGGADASGGPMTSTSSSSSSSTSSTSSSSTSSSGLSSSSSSGAVITPTDCGLLSDGSKPLCPTAHSDVACTDNQICCPGAGCQAGNSSCAVNELPCLATAQCGSGRCCALGDSELSTGSIMCQSKTVRLTASPHCTTSQNACAPNEVELCSAVGQTTCSDGKTCDVQAFPLTGADGMKYVKAVGVCL